MFARAQSRLDMIFIFWLGLDEWKNSGIAIEIELAGTDTYCLTMLWILEKNLNFGRDWRLQSSLGPTREATEVDKKKSSPKEF